MWAWQWFMALAAAPVKTGSGFQFTWTYGLAALLLPLIVGAGLAGIISLIEKLTGSRLSGGSL